MSTLNDRDRENLTAYLDGELDAKAAQELEAKINLDPDAPKRSKRSRQTWSLLDYLPKVTPSTGFTHRTMERLSLEKMGHALSYDSRARRRMRFWVKTAGWSFGLLLMLGAGFGLGQVLFPKVQQVVEADEIQPVVVPVVRKAHLPSDQDWLSDQPKSQRDQYTALKDDAKKEFVAKLKQDERQRRAEWVIAGRFSATMDHFLMAYAGKANKRIVERLRQLGVDAFGLCGLDGGAVRGTRRPDLRVREQGRTMVLHGNHVGSIDAVNTGLLPRCSRAGSHRAVPTHHRRGWDCDQCRRRSARRGGRRCARRFTLDDLRQHAGVAARSRTTRRP